MFLLVLFCASNLTSLETRVQFKPLKTMFVSKHDCCDTQWDRHRLTRVLRRVWRFWTDLHEQSRVRVRTDHLCIMMSVAALVATEPSRASAPWGVTCRRSHRCRRLMDSVWSGVGSAAAQSCRHTDAAGLKHSETTVSTIISSLTAAVISDLKRFSGDSTEKKRLSNETPDLNTSSRDRLSAG